MGHRPEKLKQSEREICSALEKEIRAAIADGCVAFITGVARGTGLRLSFYSVMMGSRLSSFAPAPMRASIVAGNRSGGNGISES